MKKCPSKSSKLFQRLISQLPEREAFRLYYILESPQFDQWYGDGKRDEDGNPILDKYFVAYSSINKPYGLFNRIQFKNVEEVERFFSSQRTEGISKFGNYYYVSKNNRIEGIKYVKALESTHPGLIKTLQYWQDSDELGGSDQSMPIMRIVINENYFTNEVYNAPKAPVETKIDSRDYIINRLQEFKSRVYDKIRDAKRDKRKEDVIKYQALWNRVNENTFDLLTEKTVSQAVKQAQIDLKYVTEVLDNPQSKESDLIEVGRLIDLYRNISKVDSKSALITNEDLEKRPIIRVKDGVEVEEIDISDLTKSIIDIGNQYERELVRYNSILKRIATKEFNSTFDEETETSELFADVKDLSAFSKARGVNSVNNKIVNLLGTMRSAAINKSNVESLESIREKDKMLEGLKKSFLYQRLGRKDFMKMLWQKNEDGKETGGLINKFSTSYWSYMKNYNAALKSKDKNAIIKAKKRHYNNHEYVNYFETEEQKLAEIERLSNIIGKDAAEGLVNEQETKFEDYRALKEIAFDNIEGSDKSKQEKQFEKDKWVIENSPEETIKSLKDGVSKPNPKGGFFFNSFEFVRSVPLKVTRDGKQTNWYDSNFEQLEEDPIALEYYEYVKNKIKELLKFYPQSYLEEKGIHKGFIPQIKEDLIHEFKQEGLKQGLKGLKELSKDWYSVKTFSKTYDHIDPGTGTTIDTLNIAMLSPKFITIDEGRVVDTRDVVMDVDDILSAFIPVTNMYKHKSRIESTYNIIAESTKLLQGVEVSPSGTLIRNTKNEAASDKSDLKHLREFVQFELDTFYGKQSSKNEKASQSKMRTKEEREEVAYIEDQIEKIDEKLSDPFKLTEEQEEKLKREKAALENKKEDIGRSFSSTKSVKSVLKWYQLLAQGWNIHSPVIELVYGMMSNFTHASGKGDFDSKQLGRAYRIALSNSKKVKNIVEKFNIVGEVVENDKNGYANSINDKFKVNRLFKPYHLQKLSDRVSKGSAGIAVLLNTSITDSEGNVSNLYDALDENGDLKPEFQTEDNLKKWSTNLDSTEISDFDRLRAKINEINIRNMGNYDPNQPIPINSKAAGAAVLQFRRWLIEGVAQRFEGERESPNLKRTIKGRYVTYKDVYNNARDNGRSGTKLIASSMMYLLLGKFSGGISNEKLIELGIENEVDIENMRKNATGVMFTIVVALALLLLQNIAGDDEDKDFSYLKFLTNMGGRLQNDLWFYANPGEANNFLGNIVPASKLYDKASLFFEASFKQLVPDYDPEWSQEFERGELKGWNKSLIRTGELIPGSSSLIKAYRLGTKIM